MLPTILGPGVDISGVCARLGVNKSTVYRWIRDGRLLAHKRPGRNGRIWVTEEALAAFVDDMRTGPALVGAGAQSGNDR